MTDYGHDLLFGTVLMPSAGRPAKSSSCTGAVSIW